MGQGESINSDSWPAAQNMSKLLADFGRHGSDAGGAGRFRNYVGFIFRNPKNNPKNPTGAIEFRDQMTGMWKQSLEKVPALEITYNNFIAKLVAMCEKGYDLPKVTTQSDRSFLHTCWEMERKKSHNLSFEDFIAYTVDTLVEQELEKVSEQDHHKDKAMDKDKEKVKEEAPWRTHPPPLPMPPTDRARGLCL